MPSGTLLWGENSTGQQLGKGRSVTSLSWALLSWCEWRPLASGTKSDSAGGPQQRARNQTLLDAFSADPLPCGQAGPHALEDAMPWTAHTSLTNLLTWGFFVHCLALGLCTVLGSSSIPTVWTAIGTDWAVKEGNRKSLKMPAWVHHTFWSGGQKNEPASWDSLVNVFFNFILTAFSITFSIYI